MPARAARRSPPAGRQQRLQRLADERPDEAAGAAELVELAEVVGPVDDLEDADDGDADERPADGQAERARRLALAHERHAGGDEHDRDGVAAETDEPAEQRLDAPAERAGQVEVDGQAEEHAGGDQADADELVLAALDGAAQLGRWPARGGCDPFGGVALDVAARPDPGRDDGAPTGAALGASASSTDPTSSWAVSDAAACAEPPATRRGSAVGLRGRGTQVRHGGPPYQGGVGHPRHRSPIGRDRSGRDRSAPRRIPPDRDDGVDGDDRAVRRPSDTSSVPPSSDCTSTAYWTAPPGPPAIANSTTSDVGQLRR